MAYLGVPIAVNGAEVHGVMRFLNPSTSPGSGFTTYDEQVARTAAHHLASKLQQQSMEQRKEAVKELFEFFWKLPESQNRQRLLAQRVFDALQKGIGECSCGIRLSDLMVLADGSRQPCLRRLACSEPIWNEHAPLYRHEEGTVSMRCFCTGEPIDVPDMQRVENLVGVSDSIRRSYGHFLMVPLGNKAGILHVARKTKGQRFGEADKHFVRHLAQLVGPVMQKIADDEQIHLENAVLKHLVKRSAGADPTTIPGWALHRLQLLQPEWSGVWSLQRGAFVLSTAPGLPVPGVAPLAPATVQSVMGGNVRVVTCLAQEPKQQQVLAELLPQSARAPAAWPQRDRAALAVRSAQGQLLAVFVLVFRDRETVSVRQLDRVAEFLQCLAPFLTPGK